jgi:hypothetical protein
LPLLAPATVAFLITLRTGCHTLPTLTLDLPNVSSLCPRVTILTGSRLPLCRPRQPMVLLHSLLCSITNRQIYDHGVAPYTRPRTPQTNYFFFSFIYFCFYFFLVSSAYVTAALGSVCSSKDTHVSPW